MKRLVHFHPGIRLESLRGRRLSLAFFTINFTEWRGRSFLGSANRRSIAGGNFVFYNRGGKKFRGKWFFSSNEEIERIVGERNGEFEVETNRGWKKKERKMKMLRRGGAKEGKMEGSGRATKERAPPHSSFKVFL